MLWSKSTMVSFGQSLFLDVLAGDDLAPTFNQHPKNLEWLLPQNDPVLAFGPNGAQFTRVQVKFKPSKANATQQTRFHDHIEGSVDEVVSPFDVAF
jgi:hypothetical protein